MASGDERDLRARAVPPLLLALALALVACTVDPIRFEGRACPCGPGWVCDEAADVCVEGLPTRDAGAARDAGADAGAPGDDAGLDASPDAGDDGGRYAAPPDAGPPDAGPTDAGPSTVSSRVAASTDDAEECLDGTAGTEPAGTMYITSTDLELTTDPSGSHCVGNQLVGMRFTGLSIPRGAAIVDAHIELTVDELHSGATSVVLSAEASDDAATFADVVNDASSRSRGTATVSWPDLPPWDTVDAIFQTPDLAPLVQEVVDRPGWASGNALVVFVEGTGRRTAESFDGEPGSAPRLVVRFFE